MIRNIYKGIVSYSSINIWNKYPVKKTNEFELNSYSVLFLVNGFGIWDLLDKIGKKMRSWVTAGLTCKGPFPSLRLNTCIIPEHEPKFRIFQYTLTMTMILIFSKGCKNLTILSINYLCINADIKWEDFWKFEREKERDRAKERPLALVSSIP